MYNPNLHFHFTGIGGSGMSGIAEVLLNLGFHVSGSDLSKTEVTERLQGLGAEIHIGHAAANVPESASLLVYSSAVTDSNPEKIEARRRQIPVVPRSEVLAELMRLKFGVAVAGSHGKTTTTSMIAAVLEAGHLDPTVIIGGQVKSMASGGKLGRGEFLVAESDESDRSFLRLRPTIAVVTNIDAEHLVAYKSFAELEGSFRQFVDAVPFYGLAVLCIDDARVRGISSSYPGRHVTYGLSPDAQVHAVNVVHGRGKMEFDLVCGSHTHGKFILPFVGQHLLVNSLAAIAVGLELGIAMEQIREALANFPGVRRRLEIMGVQRGVTVVNDYGHHPTEIRATLAAVRTGWGEELHKLYVVFQPHRYTRTRDCFSEFISAFVDADQLILTEIYPASEEPIPGVSGQTLFGAISHPDKKFEPELSRIPKDLVANLVPGDLVLCLGAGSIGALPKQLLSILAEP